MIDLFPEKHFRQKKRAETLKTRLNGLFLLTVFLFSLLLIGPLIHEASHIAWLRFHGCFYSSDLGLSVFTGLHGQVKTLCALGQTNLVIFYLIGYLSTLSAGVSLNLAGTWMHHRSRKYASIFLSAGTGMLLSVTLSIGVSGDLVQAAETLGSPVIYAHAVAALIVMGVFAGGIESFELIVEEMAQNGRKETDNIP